MRWLQNISFSSSTPSTSASSPKPSSSSFSSADESLSPSKKHNHTRKIGGALGLRIGGGGPRLTRQRKLRHLTDQDVAGSGASSTGKQVPDYAESVMLSRSPSSSPPPAPSSRLSTSVSVPLPLPLPVPENYNSEKADLRLFSPKERDRDGFRERPDGAGEGVSSSNSPVASVFAGRDMKKMAEHIETRSPGMVRPNLSNVDGSRDRIKVIIPARSAPTSMFASPVLSPQRTSNAADLFHRISKGNQVWSAPEMPVLDIPGIPPPAFLDYTAFSTDNSPLHSPPNRSPYQNPGSPAGPAWPLNAKLPIETSTAWRESNANLEVHPLPLPPGAAVPSLSGLVPHIMAKTESIPLKSQWQKGKLIGRGTFGSVYVASNRETGALCAMKEVEICPDDPKSAECIKQLEQEIKVLSQLKHPNIVQYYGSEIVEDRFYIYLEYVHPGSINKYVREHFGAITESVVRCFTRHILYGLAYLHGMKTIHRDIKGANLLVDASGVVKLADFGMAKHLTGQAADLSLKGSPYWMAPELMQAVMQKDTSSDLALAVDIWSLGCTIIEMFTGKPPWNEYEGAAAMFKVMRETPTIPEPLSPEGKDFLRCCFRRNPAERPPASILLEHRWLKNSQQLDVPWGTQLSNGIKLSDMPMPYSPRASDVKLDQMPGFPSSKSMKGKVASDSEIDQRCHHVTSDLTVTVASHYSPRSTLEALPTLSPSCSGHKTHDARSSSNSSLIKHGAKINRIFR